MKKVLITMDYDPTSQKVAEKGFAMAKAMHAEIILLHVISKPVLYYTAYDAMVPQQIKDIKELKIESQNFLDKTKKHLGDETIQTLIKEGETSDSILEAVKDLNVDIIVLGTHSRKWLEKILMGSVAESVLKHSTIPLLIIPTKKEDE